MSRPWKNVSLALAFVAAILLGGCSSGGNSKKIQIVDIGWVIYNIDYSYWRDGFTSANCLGRFSIDYSGDPISLGDIQYARYRKSGASGYWSFPTDSSHVDLSRGCIYGTMNYTTSLDANGYVFPIGQMVFEAGLSNGYTASYTFDVPAPGQLTSAGKNAVYTEEYNGYLYADYTAMLKRPVTGAHSKTTTIGISFSSNDPLFFNGSVAFYDSSNALVGESGHFRAYGTYGSIASFFNGSLQFYNNGTTNSLVIQPGDITYEPGGAYSTIAKYRIFLTDGGQYVGTTHTYDCMAIGPLVAF